jgi:hypothetical protein
MTHNSAQHMLDYTPKCRTYGSRQNIGYLGSETQDLTTESNTYETTLDKFFQWCNTTTDCAVNGQDAARIFDNLIASTNTKLIPALGCSDDGNSPCKSDVTGEEILSQV